MTTTDFGPRRLFWIFSKSKIGHRKNSEKLRCPLGWGLGSFFASTTCRILCSTIWQSLWRTLMLYSGHKRFEMVTKNTFRCNSDRSAARAVIAKVACRHCRPHWDLSNGVSCVKIWQYATSGDTWYIIKEKIRIDRGRVTFYRINIFPAGLMFFRPGK